MRIHPRGDPRLVIPQIIVEQWQSKATERGTLSLFLSDVMTLTPSST